MMPPLDRAPTDAALLAAAAATPATAVATGRFVGNWGFAALGLIGAVSIYAALELRPLFADAAHYLVTILRIEDFMLAAPARRMVEWIRQFPVLFAVQFGVTDLATLTLLLSFSFALTPILLTALSWIVLPRDKKWFFIFPMLHFCAGTLAGIFSAQQEGFTAAGVFWLLFFYLLFRTTHTRAINIMIGVSLPTVVLHEAMLFLGPVLAFAAVVRARGERVPAERIAFGWLALWFMIVAAIQIDFIANPRHVGFGAGYLRDLLNGGWLVDQHGAFNLSAALGLAGLVLVGVLALLQSLNEARWRCVGWRLVIGFGGIAACALVFLAATDRMLDIGPQFRSRNHCLLLSAPLALVALLAYLRPTLISPATIRQAAIVCAIAAAVGAIWQTHGVVQWSRALAVFRGMLSDNTGFVEWDIALARLPPGQKRLVSMMVHGWVVSPMSIILSPGGKVSTMVGISKAQGFRPFDPLDPTQLPKSRFWDITPYLAALAARPPNGKAPP